VREVFGFVKKNYPERSGGRAPQARKGWERGGSRFLRLSTRKPRRALARRLCTATLLAHGITTHLDAMGVMNEAVECSVGGGGIADLFVPAGQSEVARLGSSNGFW
jgi:hypothetical protein